DIDYGKKAEKSENNKNTETNISIQSKYGGGIVPYDDVPDLSELNLETLEKIFYSKNGGLYGFYDYWYCNKDNKKYHNMFYENDNMICVYTKYGDLRMTKTRTGAIKRIICMRISVINYLKRYGNYTSDKLRNNMLETVDKKENMVKSGKFQDYIVKKIKDNNKMLSITREEIEKLQKNESNCEVFLPDIVEWIEKEDEDKLEKYDWKKKKKNKKKYSSTSKESSENNEIYFSNDESSYENIKTYSIGSEQIKPNIKNYFSMNSSSSESSESIQKNKKIVSGSCSSEEYKKPKRKNERKLSSSSEKLRRKRK
nr:hypothetical protein [Nitrosopumilus sp.]